VDSQCTEELFLSMLQIPTVEIAIIEEISDSRHVRGLKEKQSPTFQVREHNKRGVSQSLPLAIRPALPPWHLSRRNRISFF
jgi:hypothetical protein